MNINPKESHFLERKTSSLQNSGQLQKIAKNIDKLFSGIISESNQIVQTANVANEIISVMKQLLFFVDGNIWQGNIAALDNKANLRQSLLDDINKK